MATRQRRVGHPAPTFKVETITPEIAAQLLDHPNLKRPIRDTQVEKLVKIMEAGKFKMNAQTVVINRNGILDDGHHRLIAIVKTGLPQELLVARGTDPEVINTMDLNVPRKPSDILHYNGETQAVTLAAVLKIVYKLKRDGYTSPRDNMTMDELVDILEDHPDIRVSVQVGVWASEEAITSYPKSVLAAAHWMITQVNGVEVADEFINRVVTLSNEPAGSPILALTKRMNTVHRVNSRSNAKTALTAVIKAWNYMAAGEEAKKLYLVSKNADPSKTRVPAVKVLAEKGRRKYHFRSSAIAS